MKKKLFLNTITSIILQVITVICGFILPRLILGCYGSDVNGLVQSITQFIGLIAFMELGIGAVIQSALYKPLAENDNVQIGRVMSSGNKFFLRLSLLLSIYVCILIVLFPFISSNNFGWMFTATLIAAMCVSSFAQYVFGILDYLLLIADQKGYVYYSIQSVTLIMNTIACALLIRAGSSIQLVKLVTSLIFLIRPIILRIYVNLKYKINRKERYDEEPIKQKWNGIAQHISSVVIDGTDSIVLTTCSSLSNVSIYSVYHNVVYGVKNLFLSATNGFQSVLGDFYARERKQELVSFFNTVHFIIHTMTVFLFTCTAILIVPFISVYTYGIYDANYIQPAFAVLLVCANAVHCLRIPYHIMIKAAGHYKQTQMCYIIAAVTNIVISIITVYFWGLIGVAIGTLVAMIYQTVWMALYTSKNLIDWQIGKFIKQIIFDLILCFAIYGTTFWLRLIDINYYSWVILAIEVFCIALLITIAVSFIFYRKQMTLIFFSLLGKFKKKNSNKNTNI